MNLHSLTLAAALTCVSILAQVCFLAVPALLSSTFYDMGMVHQKSGAKKKRSIPETESRKQKTAEIFRFQRFFCYLVEISGIEPLTS